MRKAGLALTLKGTQQGGLAWARCACFCHRGKCWYSEAKALRERYSLKRQKTKDILDRVSLSEGGALENHTEGGSPRVSGSSVSNPQYESDGVRESWAGALGSA